MLRDGNRRGLQIYAAAAPLVPENHIGVFGGEQKFQPELEIPGALRQ